MRLHANAKTCPHSRRLAPQAPRARQFITTRLGAYDAELLETSRHRAS